MKDASISKSQLPMERATQSLCTECSSNPAIFRLADLSGRKLPGGLCRSCITALQCDPDIEEKAILCSADRSRPASLEMIEKAAREYDAFSQKLGAVPVRKKR